MLELTFSTHDAALIELARAYWSRKEDGKWTHSVSELGVLFPQRKPIATTVGKSCTAYCDAIRCENEQCGKPIALRGRAAFDSYWKDVTTPKGKLRAPLGSRLCRECTLRFIETCRREHEAHRAAQQAAVSTWLDAQSKRQPARGFSEASAQEAFLLYGLLQSAGDAWLDGRLPPINLLKQRLFAHDEDTKVALELLHDLGWIYPSLANPPLIFSVTARGAIEFDWKLIHWTVSSPAASAAQPAIVDLLDEVIRYAPTTEWLGVWEWVCLSELRSQFERCRRQAGIRGSEWTPLIEQNFRRLLDRFSLSQLMGVIWNTFKELKWQHTPQTQVAHRVPGSFDRFIDNREANGRGIEPWWKPPRWEATPLYTSLLFDKVLAGGDEFFLRLTRADLRRML